MTKMGKEREKFQAAFMNVLAEYNVDGNGWRWRVSGTTFDELVEPIIRRLNARTQRKGKRNARKRR